MASATCFHQFCQIPFQWSYLIGHSLTLDKFETKVKASGSSAPWAMLLTMALGTQSRLLQGALSWPQTEHSYPHGVKTDPLASSIPLTHWGRMTSWLSGKDQQRERCDWWGPLVPKMETIPCDSGDLWLFTFPGMLSYC